MAIPTVKLQDPQLDIVPRTYYAKMGGSDITYNNYSAISSTNSQVVFSTTTPSVNVGLSRRLYWEGGIGVSFPATIPDNQLPTFSTITQGNGGTIGLRPFPLANICDTVSEKFNNATITVNLNDIIHALMRYGTSPDERNKFMSGSPSFPDELNSYADINGSGAGARNPFSQYSTNVEEISRLPLAWLQSVVYAAAPNATRVRSFVLQFLEPLFVSPINWSEKDVLSLFGVQTIDITLSLGSNLKNRIFAGAFTSISANTTPITTGGLNGLTDAVVQLLGDNSSKPKLHVLYITPQINMTVPKLLHYPYYEVGRYITNGANLAPNKFITSGVTNPACVAFNTSVSNITLHSVPKRIYIYARVQQSIYDTNTVVTAANPATYAQGGNAIPNIFGRIPRISLNWNNRAGILSSAAEYDLYRMSVVNGCDQSWTEWTTYSGSVLCIEPSVQMGLSPLEAPGSRGNYQLQYNLDYVNLLYDDTTLGPVGAPNTYPYNIYTVVINEGFMTVNDSTISLDIGVLTEEAIKNSTWAPPGTFNEISNLWGGGFFQDLWKGIKSVGSVAGKVISPVSQLVGDVAGLIPHPAAQAVSGIAHGVNRVAKSLGSGRRAAVRGGTLSGGAKMSRRGLSKRM